MGADHEAGIVLGCRSAERNTVDQQSSNVHALCVLGRLMETFDNRVNQCSHIGKVVEVSWKLYKIHVFRHGMSYSREHLPASDY